MGLMRVTGETQFHTYPISSPFFQSLYHIPAFQQKILGYTPPSLPNGSTNFPPCVMFVLELQKIFALLIKSTKMYIDPSLAIQVKG